jgi:hypothetical protein
MAKTTEKRPLPDKVAAHHAVSANTTRTTPKVPMMPHALLAQTDNLGGRATSRICATALIPTKMRRKLLLQQLKRLQQRRL